MRVKGITEHALRDAVDQANFDYDNNIKFKREPERIGNFLHFTLSVNDSSAIGGRISHSGRRVAALCWHGHRDVMRIIFEEHPEALLITAFARYEGLEGFMENYPDTGDRNIGSYHQPMAMQHACCC